MAGNEAVIVFGGTHAAMRGEKILMESEMPVRVMALPDQIGAGCGICLRVGLPDAEKAVALLQENSVEPQGVYVSERGPEGMVYVKQEM